METILNRFISIISRVRWQTVTYYITLNSCVTWPKEGSAVFLETLRIDKVWPIQYRNSIQRRKGYLFAEISDMYHVPH